MCSERCLFRPRVGIPVHPQQPLLRGMGIDLGGGEAHVAQEFLHGHQVCPLLKKVRREGMPEGVRRQPPGARRGLKAPPNRFLNGPP